MVIKTSMFCSCLHCPYPYHRHEINSSQSIMNNTAEVDSLFTSTAVIKIKGAQLVAKRSPALYI
jgi:hypothetical protein